MTCPSVCVLTFRALGQTHKIFNETSEHACFISINGYSTLHYVCRLYLTKSKPLQNICARYPVVTLGTLFSAFWDLNNTGHIWSNIRNITSLVWRAMKTQSCYYLDEIMQGMKHSPWMSWSKDSMLHVNGERKCFLITSYVYKFVFLEDYMIIFSIYNICTVCFSTLII